MTARFLPKDREAWERLNVAVATILRRHARGKPVTPNMIMAVQKAHGRTGKAVWPSMAEQDVQLAITYRKFAFDLGRYTAGPDEFIETVSRIHHQFVAMMDEARPKPVVAPPAPTRPGYWVD